MGWRISFGIGPLRYSSSLTPRRRRTTAYRHVSTYQPPPIADPYDRRTTKTDKIVMLVGVGVVLIVVVGLVIAAAMS